MLGIPDEESEGKRKRVNLFLGLAWEGILHRLSRLRYHMGRRSFAEYRHSLFSPFKLSSLAHIFLNIPWE
jgi:hypothetical protein